MRYLRLLRFAWLLLRHRVDAELPPGMLPPGLRLALAPFRFIPPPREGAFAHALERSGPVFIKFGQFLSSRPDLIGERMARDLSRLQDACAPMPMKQIRTRIEKDFNCSLEEVYPVFDKEPIAAASLAQVHKAELADGQQVAVKVLRPKIRRRVERDLVTLELLANSFIWPLIGARAVAEIHSQFASTLRSECDLRLEAANGQTMAEHAEAHGLLVVPKVHWSHSGSNIMTSDYLNNAIASSDRQAMLAAGIDVPKLAQDAARAFFQQVVVDNFFHGDMHPGNILVLPPEPGVRDEACWAAVDCAVAGRLREPDLNLMARLLRQMLKHDYFGLAHTLEVAGWVEPKFPTAELPARLRATLEPILGRSLKDIPYAEIISEIMSGSRVIGIVIPARFALLLKSVASVEGLGRRIAPDLNIWDLLADSLRQWQRNRIRPDKLAETIKNFVQDWDGSALQQLPDRLLRLAYQESEDDRYATRKPHPESPHQSGKRWLNQLIGLALVSGAFTVELLELGGGQATVAPMAAMAFGIGALMLLLNR